MAEDKVLIELPEPGKTGQYSLGQLLQQRRSLREYSSQSLSLAEVGQLLWAAQGITDLRGFRTAPSAGALYPLELYIVAGNVSGLAPGVYRYQVRKHRLIQHITGDKRKELARAALSQNWLAEAPVVFVFCAEYKRTSIKYGKRAKRYVHMEVGLSLIHIRRCRRITKRLYLGVRRIIKKIFFKIIIRQRVWIRDDGGLG